PGRRRRHGGQRGEHDREPQQSAHIGDLRSLLWIMASRYRGMEVRHMANAARMDVDIAIIGAGPAGLFAAYYAGLRGLSTAPIDALPEPGGQITAMYPEKQIFDVAGFPTVRGRDLVAGLVEQAA